MQRKPSETGVIALKGESIEFELESKEDFPPNGPTFFLNGEVQPTVSLGVQMDVSVQTDDGETTIEGKDNLGFNNTTSANITFNQSGLNKVLAVWSSDPDLNFEKVIRNKGDTIPTDCGGFRWKVLVVDEETNIDQLKQLLNDLGSISTLYGGYKAIDWLYSKLENKKEETDDESEPNEDEEYFQEKISNF